MERLPVEQALKAQTEAFKAVTFNEQRRLWKRVRAGCGDDSNSGAGNRTNLTEIRQWN